MIESWKDNKFPKPPKVVVECKHHVHSESFHYDKAGAIYKAEPLVTLSPEGVPCFSFVGGRHTNERRNRFIEQPPSDFHCLFVAKAHPDQGDGFMDDQIAGAKDLFIGFDKSDSEAMEAVGLISEGEERGCVNEDGRAKQAGQWFHGFSCRYLSWS